MAAPLARTAGPPDARRGPAGPGGATQLRRSQRRAAALLITPFFVLFGAVMVAPIGYALWMSLFQERSSGLGFGGTRRVFAGLANYTAALSDPGFRASFAHIALYCALYIPVMIGGSLALALLVDSALARAKRFFQLALFLPHAIPGLIASIIWIYLYTPGLSPVLDWISATGGSWDFYANDHVLLSMVNLSAWQWTGYNMVIFYAALQAVPREVIEAAVVDGAGALRTALRIKIPMIASAIVITVLFTCVGAIQLFTEPKLLNQRGAPSIDTEWSPTLFIWKAGFVQHDYGLAAAASLLLAALGVALSLVVTRIGNRWKAAA
ncbi:carbohydrate ABC transporter permease [Streptomyces sp. Ag109_G2-15]|uniref:carbohydrate ABC transporter permease n=1 Tax=Streptomyces sp. Ag109_G2-15 TaxID=1938850 RepID=UPI000BCE151A|nr:sugar ABC transporter permease [Streptomyces sp. Ag109_G2-15]SOE07069.1 carbohydrate ABC transporter membrane protein 1, CUT1 family [Streptomyces sp. Ag109_G2-15]